MPQLGALHLLGLGLGPAAGAVAEVGLLGGARLGDIVLLYHNVRRLHVRFVFALPGGSPPLGGVKSIFVPKTENDPLNIRVGGGWWIQSAFSERHRVSTKL